MEMNTLSLLMPTMQTKIAAPPLGGGQLSTGFAGLLAILQQLPGLGPEAAIVASQLAGSDEQAGSLPKLFAALLPQLMPQLMPAGSVPPPEQEEVGTGNAAFYLPAALQGLPLQLPELAGVGANGKVYSGQAAILHGSLLQAAAVAELGAEKLLAEPVTDVFQTAVVTQQRVENLPPEILPEAAFQATAVAKPGAEMLSPEPISATVFQSATVPDLSVEKLLSEALPAGQNDAAADQPAAAAKPAHEKVTSLPWQMADKTVPDLPVSRLKKPEPLTNIQGAPALGYQAFPDRQALSAAVQFTQSPLDRVAVAEQVLEKMVFRRELDGDSSLYVRLKPAALGEVQINLRLEDGRLMARIITENLYVKEALEAALGQVKQRLETQQIQVAELTVTVDHQQDFRQDRTSGPLWQQAEIKGKRLGTATAGADGVGSQLVNLRQGLVDARV